MPQKRRRIVVNKVETSARSVTGSAVTNGSRLLPSQDGRSAWARIMRSTLVMLTNHCGGEDNISDTKRLAARRVAALEAELIFAEDRIASLREDGDEPSDAMLDLYGRLSDRQRRLCEALGWSRSSRDVTPDLSNYMQQPRSRYDDGDR